MAKKTRPKEVPQQKQQPSEMTINVRGQKRNYYYVKTVESMEELETYRFKNFCVFTGRIWSKKIRDVSKAFIMPCTWKKFGKRCEFELRAVRPNLDNGTIHVYAHAQHNHPIVPEERRVLTRKEKELMTDANPPAIFRTADNMEWQFLQTLPDYAKMQKFRRENHGQGISRASRRGGEIFGRARFFCKSRNKQNQCKFMLLAIKTTTNGYHVYKHGTHNLHYFIPAENPPSTFNSPDNLEWTFLQTFADFDKMDEFRRANHTKRPKRWFRKSWQKIRLYCDRQRKARRHNCGFMLLAMKTTKKEYHVYKHGQHEHSNHPAAPNRKQLSLRDDEQNVDQQEQMVEDEEDEDSEDDEEEEMEEGDDEEEDEPIADEKEEKPIKIKEEIEEIAEPPNEDEENDNILLKEDKPIKEEVKEEGEEEKEEIEGIEANPFAISREETLKIKLENANEKVYKWMAGIESNEIGQTIGNWDNLSLLKMVEMADQEIREHPQKLNLWLPWLKCAIPKCLPQIKGFNVRFKNLIKLTCD